MASRYMVTDARPKRSIVTMSTYAIKANLANAARLIRQRGWHDGFGDEGPKGQLCTLSAIKLASGESYLGETAAYFRANITGGTSIAAWNSEDDQSQESVLAALDKLSITEIVTDTAE